MILAAGYAVRLYPLTKEFPKALLLIGKKPIIEYLIEKLEKLDNLNEIIVVTNSKFISKFKSWLRSLKSSKVISLVDDRTRSNADRRGAIGDIGFALDKKRVREDLLVIGGDNLFSYNLKSFVSFAGRLNSPVMGLYRVKNKREARKYGVLKLNAKKEIVDFKEKPHIPQSTLVAMCLYYFPKDKLNLLKEYLSNARNKRDATGYYIDWLRKKEPVYGFEFSGRWFDIGDQGFYNEARETFKKGRGMYA